MNGNHSFLANAKRALKVLKNIRIVDQRKLYLLWERNLLRQVFDRYGVDCVFDVGANVGQYAQMIRRDAGFKGLIISFEPIPEAAEALRVKAGADRNWVIQELALSSQDGEQTFNLMNDSEFSSLSTPKADGSSLFDYKNSVQSTVVVNTERLSTAYERLQSLYGFSAPFLKLDTQGFDVEIISNARDTLSQFIGLQSELAIGKLYESSVDFREAITLYEQFGFSMSAFVPNNAGHFPRMIEVDCIMIRSDLLGVRNTGNRK